MLAAEHQTLADTSMNAAVERLGTEYPKTKRAKARGANVIVSDASSRFMRASLVRVCLKVSSVALLLVAGCGSSGGKMAGGAVDASTDVDPASLPPSCLRALFAACPTDTACVFAEEDGGTHARLCYADGVKAERTGFLCSSTGGGESTDVMKPDGSLCYNLARSASMSTACEIISYVWSDGQTNVATGTLGSGQDLTITCAVGGDSATYHHAAFSPAGQAWFTTPCTAGACP
jgi:hypothetical protein